MLQCMQTMGDTDYLMDKTMPDKSCFEYKYKFAAQFGRERAGKEVPARRSSTTCCLVLAVFSETS